MSDLHLVDLTYHLVGHDNFATYHRGATRIDYLLCDTHTATAVAAGGYNPSSTGSREITEPSPLTFTFQCYLEMTTTVYKLPQRENFIPPTGNKFDNT